MSRDTISLINTYRHPTRDNLELTLRRAFPEFYLENIWLHTLARTRRSWMLPNLLCLVKEYWRDILANRENVKRRYLHTTYLFHKLRGAAARLIEPRRHVFSLQLGSMYDTSVSGVPHFIYTDHTHLSNLRNPAFDRRLLRPPQWLELERTIYQNATRIFTRSTNVTADLITQYRVPNEKIECVYAGHNVRVSPDYEPRNRNYTNRNVLFVGRDWERKGGPQLAEAFRQVMAAYPDAHLTIVGARPTLSLPNCSVLGSVPVDELSSYYAKASVFCLPSRVEPFGIAFLEAMMHRLPIVATRVEAIPDMVRDGDTGYLVAPDDIAGLAAALIRLLGDPKRCKTFGENGYKHAAGTYTWERVGERLRTSILPIVCATSRAGDSDLL